MNQRTELVLNTDWLTALLAACGLVFIVSVIAFDLWRLLHGQFTSRPVLRESGTWRVIDSFFFAWAIFVCVNFVTNSAERILKFAFGLMSTGMLVHLVMLWVRPSNSATQIAAAVRTMTELPAFILLALYGVKWFNSKVVHV